MEATLYDASFDIFYIDAVFVSTLQQLIASFVSVIRRCKIFAALQPFHLVC